MSGREEAIVELAARQHGVIARRQLIGLGVGVSAIRHRLATGRLHRLHRGVHAVYAVGHPGLEPRGRLLAAVLASGEDALLSHPSSGALWGIASDAGPIHVTTTGRGRAPRAGIVLHRVRSIHPEDRATLEGIPLTAVPRTLLDLAEIVSAERLRRAFEEAERLRLLDLAAVERLCQRSPGRRGLGPLRALLDAWDAAPGTRSELERRFASLCRDAGLPRPAFNLRVEGLEVDAAWPRRRLIVELDGFRYHRSRTAFERDRGRDRRLQLAGYRVLRITQRMLASDAAGVVKAIRSLLGEPDST